MSAPHPLNQAVIAQALHDLRNGQPVPLSRPWASARRSWMLKRPELVSMLVKCHGVGVRCR